MERTDSTSSRQKSGSNSNASFFSTISHTNPLDFSHRSRFSVRRKKAAELNSISTIMAVSSYESGRIFVTP